MSEASIPGNTPPSAPATACALCERWEKTPYFKRHTTPTTAQDTETAMVFGYWIASRKPEDVAFRLCERHGTYVFQLDTIENARLAQTQAQQAEAPSPAQQTNQIEFQRRAVKVAQRLSAPQPASLPMSPLAPGLSLLGVQPAGPIIPVIASESQQGGPVASQPGPPIPVQPEGAGDSRPRFNCPLCGKVVVSGEVHTC